MKKTSKLKSKLCAWFLVCVTVLTTLGSSGSMVFADNDISQPQTETEFSTLSVKSGEGGEISIELPDGQIETATSGDSISVEVETGSTVKATVSVTEGYEVSTYRLTTDSGDSQDIDTYDSYSFTISENATLEAQYNVVEQDTIEETQSPTSDDSETSSSSIVIIPVGEGTYTYTDNQTSETVNTEDKVFETTSSQIQLSSDENFYTYIADSESKQVGTCEETTSGDIKTIDVSSSQMSIYIVFDEDAVEKFTSLLSTETPQISLFSTARASHEVTKYRKVSDGLTAAGRFVVDGKYTAFCTDHYAVTPPKGTEITKISESNNLMLRKALYYGYGGPKESVKRNAFGWIQTTIACHMAVEGTDAGYASHREFYESLSKKASPPSNWKVYMCYTKGSYQDLCYGVMEAPPKTYTDLSVTKKWSDSNNAYKVRPKSITVYLYRSTSTPVSTSGKYYKKATLNASNKWKYTWKDELKSYVNSSGKKINYNFKLVEDVPSKYSGSVTDWSGSTSAGYSATITNTVQTGKAYLEKSSNNSTLTSGNGNYSLEGEKRGMYIYTPLHLVFHTYSIFKIFSLIIYPK